MIKFRCSNCNQKLGVPDEYVGKRVRCTRCNEPAQVPQPEIPVLEDIPETIAVNEASGQGGGEMSADEMFGNDMWDDLGAEAEVDPEEAARMEAISQAKAPPKTIKTAHIGPVRTAKKGGGGGSVMSKMKIPLIVGVVLVVIVGVLIAVVGQGGGAKDDGRSRGAVGFAENLMRTIERRDVNEMLNMLWLTPEETQSYTPEDAERVGREMQEVIDALSQGQVESVESSIEYSCLEKGASGYLIHCKIEYTTSYREADIGVIEKRGAYDIAGIVVSGSAGRIASVGASEANMMIDKVDVLVNSMSFPVSVGTILIVLGVFALIVVGSMWTVFDKAGEPGWACLVPVYSLVVLARIGDKPEWMGLVAALAGAIPVAGGILQIILLAVICIGVAESFGKGLLFGLGLCFLPIIFYPILAFTGDSAA